MNLAPTSEGRVVPYHQPVGLSTLFRPLPKLMGGARPTLDITYQASNGGPILRFCAKAALGIPEQTLLLVLIEMAQQRYLASAEGALVNSGTQSDIGQRLWGQLHRGWSNEGEQTLMLETSWHELNQRCGGQTGGAIQAMREQQLERLCEVIVWESAGDTKRTRRQSYLVALVIGNEKRIYLALNCRLASAILGKPYSQVSLAQRLALKSDIAKAIHAFLSTAIGEGRCLGIGLECLVERLWPGSAGVVPASTHRGHRRDVHDGLDAIGRLDGWSVKWDDRKIATVTRTRPGVADMTSNNGNKTMSYRQQALPKITREIKGLQAFDASGLFFIRGSGD